MIRYLIISQYETIIALVPAVARRSGVSVATFYRHFPSKDDLLAAAAAVPSRLALASTDGPAAAIVEDAIDRSLWAVRALIDATNRDGAVLDAETTT